MAHIAIVGAGPAGAALAFLLARRGARVTLIERQSDFAREFRGEVLMPSGIDAIAQMGLRDAFDALPQARPYLLDLHINGRFVRRLELPDYLDATPCMVSQPHLLEMLVAQCQAFAGFRFVRGGTVSDLIESDGRVTGVVLRGESPEEIRADLVVGADGRASLVRRRAGLDAPRDPEAFDVVWFKVPWPDHLARERGGAVQGFLRPGQLCLGIPTFDDRMQVGWVIAKGGFGDLRAAGTDAWLADLSKQVGEPLGAHLLKHRDALEHPFVLDVVCFVLEQWTAPGVLLIGDAAHPMSPVGGQGLNIALRDALVAANHLVPVLSGDDATPRALDDAARAIQTERLPEARQVQRLQRIPPRFFLRHGPWVRVLLALAGLLLRLPLPRGAERLPAITRAFLYGTTEVRLRA